MPNRWKRVSNLLDALLANGDVYKLNCTYPQPPDSLPHKFLRTLVEVWRATIAPFHRQLT